MITLDFKNFMIIGLLFYLMNSIAEFIATVITELFKKHKEKKQKQDVDTEKCLHK